MEISVCSYNAMDVIAAKLLELIYLCKPTNFLSVKRYKAVK